MLVLSRRRDQRIVIGPNQEIVLTVVEITRGKVRIGVSAPRDVPILRDELGPWVPPPPRPAPDGGAAG